MSPKLIFLNNKPTIIAIIVYLFWVIIFAYFSYTQEKVKLYQSIDQQLMDAARVAPLILPEGLHHQEMSKNDLSSKSHLELIEKISQYTDNNSITYIYTLIMRGNKILFTSSSATEKERQTGVGLSLFFSRYDDADPRLYDVFNSRKKVYLEYSDQWGTFRSIFLPTYAADGSFYLSAADISISHIQTLLRQYLYQTLIIAILFLVFAYPIFLATNYKIRQTAKSLDKKIKQQTKELSDNVERLTMAMKASKQGWFDLNIQTNEISVSDEYPLLLGYKPDEFQPNFQNWKNNLHPNDHDEILTSFGELLKSSVPKEMEYRRKTKNGSWLWIHSIGQVVEWDEQKKPLRMIGTHVDISERKRAEEVLRLLAESSSKSSDNIFHTIVKQLAQSYNVRYVFIACTDNKNPNQSTTLAMWAKDKIIENFSYSLIDTPCQNVIQHSGCFYPENIQQLFPNDKLLVEMEAQSYIGAPLINVKGEVFGLISLLDDKPMLGTPKIETLLNSLAVRVAFELERKDADEKLRLSASVFNEAHEGIMLLAPNKTIVDINPTFCEITGYDRNEIIGKNPEVFNSGKQNKAFYTNLWQTIDVHGHWKGELWNAKKNGEPYAELLTISSISDNNSDTVQYVGLFSDITTIKEQQRSLELIAHYDVLTGLPNRTLFMDRFQQSIVHSKRNKSLLAIIFLDLDNFKPVNDNYGHHVGDKLLIEVAKRITDCIRESDTVSRQGGDEFIILLGEIQSIEECNQLAKRIHESLAVPYIVEGNTITIGTSSGITLYPLDDADLDTLIRHADQAMYQAKQAGRNRYHIFNTEQDQQATKKHTRIQEIEQALSNGEFCLYYQPKVNMLTGKVFGAEALIRWIHPKKGLIPPLSFLPIIEGTILEVLIGNWVVNEALHQLEYWQEQDIELEISVNISSYHLQHSSFITALEQTLALYPKVNSYNLQLEILESSALGDILSISKTINTCTKELGVNIALDDFGTGYSSLSHLRNLAAKTIKIDQTFVRDLMDDPDDYSIIKGIIGLADSFNLDIIAEGVETLEHGKMLLLLGCHKAQGYGIARPMPADDFPDWLSNFTPTNEWKIIEHSSLSPKKIKIQFLKLSLKHWQNKFESNIKSLPNNITPWPILNKTKCHCGIFIEREKQEQLFEDSWLNNIDKAHDLIHQIANDLFDEYQEGKVENAREGLSGFKKAITLLQGVLE